MSVADIVAHVWSAYLPGWLRQARLTMKTLHRNNRLVCHRHHYEQSQHKTEHCLVKWDRIHGYISRASYPSV